MRLHTITVFLLGFSVATLRSPAEEPERIDVAAFGRILLVPRGDPGRGFPAEGSSFRPGTANRIDERTALHIEWTEPRDVSGMALSFQGEPPDPSQGPSRAPSEIPSPITVQWWRRIWPDNGGGGWMKLDDPFNGSWTPAKVKWRRQGSDLRLEFLPLGAEEAPGIQRAGAAYRRTYKLRVSFARPTVLEEVKAFTGATRRKARLRFEPAKPFDPGTDVARRFEARNGRILRVERAAPSAAVVEVEYAHSPDRTSPDRGRVIFRDGETGSFSVFIDDVIREEGILVRDVEAFVGDDEKGARRETWKRPADAWPEGTVREQVARLPEQSLEEVMKAIPAKPPQHLFLGVPSLRQEISLLPRGQVQLFLDSLRSPGPDADRRPWSWPELVYEIRGESDPTPEGGNPEVRRELEEGWLPVVLHRWSSGDLQFTETCLASTLVGDLDSLPETSPQFAEKSRMEGCGRQPAVRDLRTKTGTEPVVLAARIEISNAAAEPRSASLTLSLNHASLIRMADGGVLVLMAPSDGAERPGLTAVRGRFEARGRGAAEVIPAAGPREGGEDKEKAKDKAREKNGPPGGPILRYRVDLPAGASHAVELFVPYIELLDSTELEALRSLSFPALHDSVVRFWKERISRGMTYEVPEELLNDFFKTNLWHVLISTDIDPVTGHHHQGAATHRYRNFLNETMMVAESLEMRGEHEEALHLLEPFLACQGVKGLPGNFKSREGVFYAAHPTEPDPYTAQGYNMHHGWGLWFAARHFFWTRDEAYLRRVAGKLVSACDWISRERQATKRLVDGKRPIEYGLAPAGDLEDVEEYLYFYATSAYYYLGLKDAAEALARIGHPRAEGLAKDAAEFLQDLRSSVAESVASSPVVKLRDGSHIPYVPARAYAITHLTEGWIREALYPALHLLFCEVYPETHPFVTWMIDDLEDNVFLSKESGYGIQDPKASFFNLGGITLQPNLLDLSIAYLARDEVPGFLRAFYNTAWASLYPDAVCFAEWVPEFGRGGGPLYKTPDECKFIQWMRKMLILERDDALELGLGVPRRWMADGKEVKVSRAATLFGPLDLAIRSQVSRGNIAATVKASFRSPPGSVRLRLRHPEGKLVKSAIVNGAPAKVDAARQLIELPLPGPAWEVLAEF